MLRQLSLIPGVSGDEGRVRKFIREQIEKDCDDIRVDTMGNMIAHKKGNGPRVMLAAHMDEVGMCVKAVRDDGLIIYDQTGLDPRVVISKRVKIGPDGVPGVIGAKAIHLQTPQERTTPLAHNQLFVDIGAKDKADALKSVKPGDYISFDSPFSEFGEGLIKGKALDDRVGCFVLMEILKGTYDCDLYCTFTVQEEVGTRGAMAVGFSVEPDLAIALEGTTANDVGEVKPQRHVTSVGKGPAITFMDRGNIVNRFLFEALKDTAVKHDIPWQLRRGTAGGTDAGTISLARGGVKSGGISIPCRYIHSPQSVCAKSDIENAVKLVKAFLTDKKYDEVIGKC